MYELDTPLTFVVLAMAAAYAMAALAANLRLATAIRSALALLILGGCGGADFSASPAAVSAQPNEWPTCDG